MRTAFITFSHNLANRALNLYQPPRVPRPRPFPEVFLGRLSTIFLCCNTRVFLRKYFYRAPHFSGWTRVASCATYVRVPFITRVFPRAEIQEMAQVVRSQQHHDPVTELNQTQTRSRSEMGSRAEECFLGREGKLE